MVFRLRVFDSTIFLYIPFLYILYRSRTFCYLFVSSCGGIIFWTRMRMQFDTLL